MWFSTHALVAAVGLSAPLLSTGFVPSASFARGSSIVRSASSVSPLSLGGASVHSFGCPCAACVSRHSMGCPCAACAAARTHPASCSCPSCAGGPSTILRMSEEPAAEAEAVVADPDVPPEVAAMDGVLGDDEAHNVDRPARESLHKKHKDGGNGKKASKPLSELEVGSSVEGTVKAITSYGAFLDIGCDSDALLHVSRMADDFVSNVEDVVKQGDTVTVRVASVDLDKNQIAVTMRSVEAEARANAPRDGGGGGRRRQRPQRSAGDKGAQRESLLALADKPYDDEKFVEGEVVNTLDFGAFVRFDTSQLGEGFSGELDGLVHISVLSTGRTENVEDVVQIGNKVQVRVKNVDPEGNKIALSMIAKADESQRGRGRGGDGEDGGRPRRRQPNRWTAEEMGAKDWKESVEKYTESRTEFKNDFIVEDKRKNKQAA